MRRLPPLLLAPLDQPTLRPMLVARGIIVFVLLTSSLNGQDLTPDQQRLYNRLRLTVEAEGISMGGVGMGLVSLESWRRWRAYEGFSRISEAAFFRVAGYHEEAQKASAYRNVGVALTTVGTLVSLGGTALALVGAAQSTSREFEVVLSGVGISLIGLSVAFAGTRRLGRSWAPYAAAQEIADDYNRRLREGVMRGEVPPDRPAALKKPRQRHAAEVPPARIGYESQDTAVREKPSEGVEPVGEPEAPLLEGDTIHETNVKATAPQPGRGGAAVSLSAGLGVPAWPEVFSSGWRPGPSVGAGVEAQIGRRLLLRGSGLYQRFEPKTSSEGSGPVSVALLFGEVKAVPWDRESFQPYVVGGVGVGRIAAKINLRDSWEMRPALSFAGGATWRVGSVALFVEGGYVIVFTKQDVWSANLPTHFLPMRVGFRF